MSAAVQQHLVRLILFCTLSLSGRHIGAESVPVMPAFHHSSTDSSPWICCTEGKTTAVILVAYTSTSYSLRTSYHFVLRTSYRVLAVIIRQVLHMTRDAAVVRCLHRVTLCTAGRVAESRDRAFSRVRVLLFFLYFTHTAAVLYSSTCSTRTAVHVLLRRIPAYDTL